MNELVEIKSLCPFLIIDLKQKPWFRSNDAGMCLQAYRLIVLMLAWFKESCGS
jgi:hypothetical protein